MGKVIVLQFDGTQIGEIVRSAQGSVEIIGNTPALQVELSEVVAPLLEQTLTLIGGTKEETADSIVHRTVFIDCPPEHPLFLRALADAIGEPEHRVGRQRIRGVYDE
jgi:hypothetical protein